MRRVEAYDTKHRHGGPVSCGSLTFIGPRTHHPTFSLRGSLAPRKLPAETVAAECTSPACNSAQKGNNALNHNNITCRASCDPIACVSRRSRVMALALSSVAVGGGSSFA